MSAALHTRMSDERGFTLIEVMVAMTLAIIVLLGILNAFDGFWRNTARQTRITDANEQVRNAMDRIVADLRQARTIEVADANDLVYTVADSATSYRRERICLDGSSRIWRASATSASAPTTPIASGTPCPTPSSGAFEIAPLASANSASNPLFRYDTASAANVRIVGLTFALNAGNRGFTDVSTLRAGAFVRAKSESALPVGPDDIGTSCNSNGSSVLTLSAGLGSYTASYATIDGTSLGSGASAGTGVTIPASVTTIVVTVSSSAGASSQLLKTVLC